LACGGGNDDDGSATVNEAGTNPDEPTGSSGASTDASGDSTSTSAGESDSSSTGDITGVDSTTGAMGWSYCNPPSAPFTGQPLVASLELDFDARTCAARSGAGGPPHLVLEIQNSGLIDVTAFGVEITDASAGLLFEDPPEGDSQVIDLYPGFLIRLEGTVVGDGSPIIIEFEVTEKGPLIDDTRVDFG
jgi:hypothetical protein